MSTEKGFDDIEPSKNVVDRRGIPEPVTLSETVDRNMKEQQPERGLPDPNSPLAEQLGIKDIGKV